MHRAYHPEPLHEHSHDFHFPWRKLALVLVPCLLVVYLATGVYSVAPNECAVVRRCGKILAEVQPGLHFGFPYGIDQVSRVKKRELKRVGIWKALTDRALGRQADPRQAECLTGDRNLILISAVVQYEITDPAAYLFHVADVAGSAAGRLGVDALVEHVAAAALSSAITARPVDAVLTVDRIDIQNKVRDSVQAWLNGQAPPRQAGVQITSVSLEGVSPPQEVAEAFRDVTSARADSQRAINEAESYANVLAEQSKGETERISLDAGGFAGEATARAHGDADRFVKVAGEVAMHRDLAVRRLLLETMEEVLPRLKKVVLDTGCGQNLDLGLMEEEP